MTLKDRIRILKNEGKGRNLIAKELGISTRQARTILEELDREEKPLALAGNPVTLPEGVQVGHNYLTLPDEITDDQIGMVARTLRSLESSILWLVGDLLASVERLRGSEHAELIRDSFGISRDSAYDAWRVCRVLEHSGRPECSMRNPKVSFYHHRTVLQECKDLEEARVWLDKAAESGWSISELRSQIRSKGQDPGNRVAPLGHTGIGELFQLVRCVKKLKVEDLNPEQRGEMRKKLAPVVKFYEMLGV